MHMQQKIVIQIKAMLTYYPLLLAVSTLVGCSDGGQYASISGEIQVNGKLLDHGKIIFQPLDRNAGRGGAADIKNGLYHLRQVPFGRNVFIFSGSALTGNATTGPSGKPEPERVNVIPQEVLQRGVERNIESSGEQDFSLDGPV